MFYVIAAMVGSSLGVFMALSRVPRVRGIPIAATILGSATVLAATWDALVTVPALAVIAAVGAILGSGLYAGLLWKNTGLDPSMSYWQWVIHGSRYARYLRRAREGADVLAGRRAVN